MSEGIGKRLDNLYQGIAKQRLSADEVGAEVRAILLVEENPYVREKLKEAQEWADIYFSARKWQKWGSPGKARDYLLQEIQRAAEAVPDESRGD